MTFLILLTCMALGDLLWCFAALRLPRRWLRWTIGGFGVLQLAGLTMILDSRPSGALVVSNGVGNWFPVRIQAPAEILHLTLRRAGLPRA